MSTPFTDKCAITGKFQPAREHAQLLVIGAGPAGLAAACTAAGLGISVVLIDENPVPSALMGLDVPLFYGQRMTQAVQENGRMVERLVASDPAIEAAFDAGVDVRLGIIAWGAFANGPALQALPAQVVGLSDGVTSWLCGFDALILASGSRDLVLGFTGCDMPGVMGARAMQMLLTRYDAFAGERMLILGSGDLAAQTAITAHDRGVRVVSLIEVLPEPQASAALRAELAVRGIAVACDRVILRAEGDATGVTAAVVMPVAGGESERLACDTICLAIGAVPAIELADTLSCKLESRGDLGGHVPVCATSGETSLPGIYAVGDCAGLVSEQGAMQAGENAARAAAGWLRQSATPAIPRPAATGLDMHAYRLAWMRALQATGGLQAPVCLCEEVTRGELLGVQPPRYLGCQSSKMAARDSESLRADGPLNPDQIKRLTRAGMGPCQGRRCREQIALLLAIAGEQDVGAVPLARYRAPVRPLPLEVLADQEESPDMQAFWDVWFGIPTQWIPYADIGTPAEEAILASENAGNMHL